MKHSKSIEPEFVFTCVRHGISEPLSWRLFDHIQSKEGLVSEYEIRLYLGIGETKARLLINDLVRQRYAIEDVEQDVRGINYVDEKADEDINLLAEVELGVRLPLWHESE